MIDPKALQEAISLKVGGFDLDVVAKALGVARKRRRWWLDEGDRSLLRRCSLAFLATRRGQHSPSGV